MALPARPPLATSLNEANKLIAALWEIAQEVELLREESAQLREENATLQAEVAELKTQVEELLDRAGKSSRNSSLPPSSDSTAQRAKRPKRKRKSSRGKGAQPGHDGHFRELLDEAELDGVERHLPTAQCSCGGAVAIEGEPFLRHQVFDLPIVKYTVIEHQLYHGVCCACGVKHSGHLPDCIPSGQMGPGLVAWGVMMSAQYHLSMRQTQSLLLEQWQLPFSVGAISQSQDKALNWLAPHYADIGVYVREQKVAHADETRIFFGSTCYWLWSLCTTSVLYLMVHYSRGKGAASELLKGFHGYLVTDHFASYNVHPRHMRQLCWAHLARHFRAISERPGFAGKTGARLLFASDTVFRTRHRFDNGEISEKIYRRRMKRIRQSFSYWLDLGSIASGHRRTTRQCRHLLKDEEMCWTFLSDNRIPLTNNTAEQSLRGYVIWRKLSFAVQSGQGQCFVPMAMSVIETAKRLRVSTYALLRRSSEEYVRTGRVETRLPLRSKQLGSH